MEKGEEFGPESSKQRDGGMLWFGDKKKGEAMALMDRGNRLLRTKSIPARERVKKSSIDKNQKRMESTSNLGKWPGRPSAEGKKKREGEVL